jgi:PAS domain S-box-containing protein
MPSSAAEQHGSAAARLDAVVRQVADAVVQLDAAGCVTAWNPAASRMLGLAESEVVGRSFAGFLDDDHAAQWQRLVADAARGASTTLPAVVLHRPDGLPVHASLSATPICGEPGQTTGCCLVVQDHTERQLAQAALADAQERVRRSEALAVVGSFVLDAADGTVQWSEGMHRIFGLPPGAFDGTREAYLDSVHPDDRVAVAAAVDRALCEGRSSELDHRATVDGRTIWVFLATEPVRDGSGRITGARGVCQDITSRKEAEESVRGALSLAERANEELRAIDRLKDEFLATVSHELRTPLTAIMGFASVLMRTAPHLGDYVQPIARGGADMAHMVEKLLDYSRLQSGQIKLNAEVVALATEVDRLLDVHRGPDGTQRLVNEVPRDLRLRTDVEALDRIIGNLVGNARRYAGEGSTVRVTADVEPDGATLITVADNGPGIPAEHLGRLFERFYQVPGTGSRRGTGLGLAIVREYVTRQGGTVWCESEPGQGTAFHIRLPAYSDVGRTG